MARPISQENKLILDRFTRMRPKDSAFVAGIMPSDVEFIRAPLLRRGVGVRIERVAHDPVHHQAGVRVFREEGSYDEL